MKSIVVPVNFSPCSENAARYAADLALAIRADLHLVHIIQIPAASGEMVITEALYQDMVDSASNTLTTLKIELRKRTGFNIQVNTIMEVGSVIGKVNEICGRLSPCAIILGASGPTFEKFLVGSPVTSLLNLHFPVLFVPETVNFHAFRHVLLACDLDDIGSGLPASLPLLKDLREYFNASFDIVTVETRCILSEEEKVFQSDSWKMQLKDLYPEIHFIRKPKVEDGVLDYLGRNEADLIIVFPKKHQLFEFHVSQSKKITRHSKIPVMSLHE